MVDVVRTKFWQKIKGIKGFHKLAFNALVLYFVIADSSTPKYVKGIADDDHIRMLFVYPKGKQGNLTQNQIKQLRTIVERW